MTREGNMDHITTQITRLTNPRADTRYDACEELRVASSLPPQALSALQRAAQDPDPGVADAAQRALRLHIGPPPAVPVPASESLIAPGVTVPVIYRRNAMVTAALAALISSIIVALFGVLMSGASTETIAYVVLVFPFVLPFTYVTTRMYRRSQRPERSELLTTSLVGVGANISLCGLLSFFIVCAC